MISACLCLLYVLLNHRWILTLSSLHFPVEAKRIPVILFYTSWNVEQYWSDLFPEKLNYHLNDINCSYRDCKITYDKNRLHEASAVLFHGQDLGSDEIYSPESLRGLSRPMNQYWIWVNQESPSNIRNTNQYNGVFNWTATYHRSSDIFLPYGGYVAREIESEIEHDKFVQRIVRQKRKLIAWAVSDCKGLRENLVLQLQNFLDITVFGKCRKNFKIQDTCIVDTQECDKKLSEFKFYLAFENSYCEDYVTEKYWKNALEHNSVPIVFGKNYDEDVAIPGSYINVNEFNSIRELVQFIKFLDKNDQHYAKYFDWKRKYTIKPVNDLICSVCQKLHRFPLDMKTYENLGEYWNEDKFCISGEDAIKYDIGT